jgi:hypothetical protein
MYMNTSHGTLNTTTAVKEIPKLFVCISVLECPVCECVKHLTGAWRLKTPSSFNIN